jgi:hypothetical protein
VTGPAPARPLPGCPARDGTGTWSVTAAHFFLDIRDSPAKDGTGGTVTEVAGYFRPAGTSTDSPTSTGTDTGTGTGGELDLVGVGGLELPAGSPDARAAWRAFRSLAGPDLIGRAMRAAITACPCTFPLTDCAAMDEDTLRNAIAQAAALAPSNGQREDQ